jgi:hypothetical protein
MTAPSKAWGFSFSISWGVSFGTNIIPPVEGNEVKFIEIRSFTQSRRI